jgi:SAM-dependent MidA family methyltransferase
MIGWRAATATALYGPRGFYRRAGAGPAAHFRTSVHACPLYAGALLRLLRAVDDALGHPDPLDVADIGAGRGELLLGLREALRTTADHPPTDLGARVRLTAVEVAARPADLPADIGWVGEVPAGVVGLMVANEWLDDVPVDVVVSTPDGLRIVLVDPVTGEESWSGPVPGPEDLRWLERWWPLAGAAPGARAEVGRPRDQAWAATVSSLRCGVAVAVDYGHTRADRAAGHFATGTLAGYRGGRLVPPVPDGSCDVTSHVALDACADAGVTAGAGAGVLCTQREALTALGVGVLPELGARPAYEMARSDPRRYLEALVRTGQAAELTARTGLGAFTWLAQAVDLPVVPLLRQQRIRCACRCSGDRKAT